MAWTFLGALILIWVTLFSNGGDWDSFYTLNEVDRRLWLTGSMPDWSYQLCGGHTRSGDPESFAFSLPFALVMLADTVWGTKLLVLAMAAVGFVGAQQFLGVLTSQKTPAGFHVPVTLWWLLGGYMVWHLQIGHVSFAPFHLGLALLAATLALAWKRDTARTWWWAALCAWLVYSGSLFHVSAYLLLPALLALSFAQGVLALQQRSWQPLVRLGWAATPHVAGLVLAAYRIVPSLQYQADHPRTVATTAVAEAQPLMHSLVHQLLPATDSGLPWAWGGKPLFDAWEYNAFTPLPLVALGLWWWLRRNQVPSERAGPAWVYLLSLAACSLAFALGNVGAWAPFTVFNHLLRDSVRCVGRFHVGLTLVAMGAAWLLMLRVQQRAPQLARRVGVALAVGALVHGAAFLPSTSPAELAGLLALDAAPPDCFRQVAVVHPRTDRSFTFPATRAGFPVLNCYVSIEHQNVLGRSVFQASMSMAGHPERVILMDTVVPAANDAACAQRSCVGATSIQLDPSCGPVTCLRVNGLSPADRDRLVWNPQAGMLCIPEDASAGAP